MSELLISTNPGKGYEEIGTVTVSSEQEIKDKVTKAHEARLGWKEMPVRERIAYLQKFLDIYTERKEEFSQIQSKEVGKPITQSREDEEINIEWLTHKLSIAEEVLAPAVLDSFDTYQTVLYREPYGVAAVIVPWNFPTGNFFLATMHLLLAGNVVVFKHSEECPLTGQMFEDAMRDAGLPEGVFSEVYGSRDVGEVLTEQDINFIHFTGSSRAGESIYKKAAEKFIPVVLEMGGSSPGIVFPDADIQAMAESVCIERFSNCGQICNALKRLIVHTSVVEEVTDALRIALERWVVGDPLNENTQVGPLVAKRQLDLLVEQVDEAKEKGATVIMGGDVVSGLHGAYYQPTLLTNVTFDMRVWKEEVFGPVLPIVTFETEEEAVRLANDTEYGLSGYVYGNDIEQLKRIASQIDAGQISINGLLYFSPNAPFGGYKKSGIGRNDGRLGFDDVTQKKVVAEPK